LKSTVSVVKCDDYTSSTVSTAVGEAVQLLGGMAQFIQPGQKVLLKPNLLSTHPPESAVTTHPSVVEAVARLAASAGGICSIGDSPAVGGDTTEGYERLLKITGMSEAAANSGAATVCFDSAAEDREIQGAEVFKRLLLTKALSDSDLLINIPKFKTHALTKVTGAVKNLFGCIPGRRKAEFHLQAGNSPETFAQILVDVLRAVRPQLSIMDAVVAMEGHGPSAGYPRKIGLILASADPVALDAVACRIVGVDPLSVPTLRLANEQGLGAVADSDIEVVGMPIESIAISNFLLPPSGDTLCRVPGFLYRFLRNQLTYRPSFLQEVCVGCGACANICPTHAITGKGNRLKIDYSACIRCYCCQEVCPVKAVVLKPGLLRRLVGKFFEGNCGSGN